jgi:hypothetical protein
MSEFNFNDENEWLKNWRINQIGVNDSTGRCSSYKTDDTLKYSTTNGTPPSTQTKLFDYYVCGTNDTDDAPDSYGYCKGLTTDEWGGTSGIWKNCMVGSHGSYDPCWNMVHDGLPTNARPGSDFYAARDSARYDPTTNKWSNGEDQDDGFHHQFQVTPMTDYGGESSQDQITMSRWTKTPAYPVDTTLLDSIGNKPTDSTYGLETREDYGTHQCPTGYRSFVCAGDGSSEDDGGTIPGCGTGREFNDLSGDGQDYNGHQDSIRFCARAHSDWYYKNLMGCCLDDKGDPDKSGHKKCPVDYCRSSISQTDIISSDTVCEEGYNENDDLDKLVCYEMTDKCNSLFQTHCTADLFNDTTGSKIEEQIYCRKWAKIQPDKFQRFADNICSLEKRLNISDDEDMTTVLQTSDSKRTMVKRIFQSELCRDHLLNNDNSKQLLREICAAGVEMKSETEWEITPFGESMSGMCDCYFPNEYYQWYKTYNDELSEDEKRAAAGKVRPECFHMGCARSGNYSTVGNSECPDVQLCIQTINDYSTVVAGSRFGEVQRQPASRQSCNFNIINPDGGPLLPVDTGNPMVGLTTGTTGPTAGTDSTPGTTGGTDNYNQYGSGDGYSSGDTSYDNDSYSSSNYRDEEGTSSTGDDNTMTLLIIAGIFMFCCMMMVMMMMGGGGGGGSGRGYPPPMMNPYGRY